MFYENEFGTVRETNKSSFKMMPGKKRRRAYSLMGQKVIVLNPHCIDNQTSIDEKLEKIKDLKEKLENIIKQECSQLEVLDNNIRMSK